VTRTILCDPDTGGVLDGARLAEFRQRAHRLYETNAHIFEDELDALTALGVVHTEDDGTTAGLWPGFDHAA
jgi:hypothetical protein